MLNYLLYHLLLNYLVFTNFTILITIAAILLTFQHLSNLLLANTNPIVAIKVQLFSSFISNFHLAFNFIVLIHLELFIVTVFLSLFDISLLLIANLSYLDNLFL